MILETEFRFAIGYLLILRLGLCTWLQHDEASSAQLDSAPRAVRSYQNTAGWLVQLLYLGPFLVLLTEPGWLGFAQLGLPHPLRWLATIPMAASILFSLWAERSEVASRLPLAVEPAGGIRWKGPYRWIRYPDEIGQMLFYLSLAALAANWAAAVSALGGLIVVRIVLVPRWERHFRCELGAVYGEYSRQTGRLLPQLGDLPDRQYAVPRRFGMAAIVALMTIFCIIFGCLRYWEAHPVYYMFVSSEVVAICLAQILVGTAPRWGSILTGALLLPLWVTLSVNDSLAWLSRDWLLACYAFFFLFGGLLGYCIGALAAGFFLVMDIVDPFLPGGPERHVSSSAGGHNPSLPVPTSPPSAQKGKENGKTQDPDARRRLRGRLRSDGPVPDPPDGRLRGARRLPRQKGR